MPSSVTLCSTGSTSPTKPELTRSRSQSRPPAAAASAPTPSSAARAAAISTVRPARRGRRALPSALSLSSTRARRRSLSGSEGFGSPSGQAAASSSEIFASI